MRRLAIFTCVVMLILPAFGQKTAVTPDSLDLLEPQIKLKPDSCLLRLREIQHSEPTLLPKTTYLIGNCFLRKKQTDSAVLYYIKAEDLAGNDSELLGKINYALGNIFFEKADYKHSIQLYNKTNYFLASTTDMEMKCLLNNELGNAYLAINQTDSALFFFSNALTYANVFGEKKLVARTLNNLSITYYKLGNFEKAIEWQLQAISIKEQLPDTISLATSLNNIGSFFIKLDNYNDAKRYLTRAYQLMSNQQNGKIKGYSTMNLGICYKMLNNNDSALYFYHQALEIYTNLELKSSIGKIYSNLGGLYEAKKNYDKALEYMILSLEIGKSMNLIEETAIRNRNIANVYLLLNKPDLARDYILEAQKGASSLKSMELNMEVFNTLSDYYEKVGNYKLAFHYFKENKKVTDSLFAEGNVHHINELNIIYETEKKDKNIVNLLDQKRISDLTIKQKEDALFRQRLILFSTILVAALVFLTMYLGFTRYKLKERNAREILARQKSDLEQRMLLSQMNPHFIFNSLGSIQNFIGHHDPSKAQLFLSKFAKLMRSILENSRQQFIPVEEEKEALLLYLALEKERFPGRFDYKIDIQMDEPEFILIPPMMVQPFIENAILHAFTNSDKKGQLLVEYKIENEMIQCCITDNGVGRHKSAENKKAGSTHNSLGSTVVSERIELLRKEFLCDASIVYHDLELAAGTLSGTKVVMNLPFKERES